MFSTITDRRWRLRAGFPSHEPAPWMHAYYHSHYEGESEGTHQQYSFSSQSDDALQEMSWSPSAWVAALGPELGMPVVVVPIFSVWSSAFCISRKRWRRSSSSLSWWWWWWWWECRATVKSSPWFLQLPTHPQISGEIETEAWSRPLAAAESCIYAVENAMIHHAGRHEAMVHRIERTREIDGR